MDEGGSGAGKLIRGELDCRGRAVSRASRALHRAGSRRSLLIVGAAGIGKTFPPGIPRCARTNLCRPRAAGRPARSASAACRAPRLWFEPRQRASACHYHPSEAAGSGLPSGASALRGGRCGTALAVKLTRRNPGVKRVRTVPGDLVALTTRLLLWITAFVEGDAGESQRHSYGVHGAELRFRRLDTLALQHADYLRSDSRNRVADHLGLRW